MEYKLYRICLSYACYGILVDDKNIIRETAPIASWAKGKSINHFNKWVKSKGGLCESIDTK